jgi:D-lactate dehydrogenase
MAKIYFYDCTDDEISFFKDHIKDHDCTYSLEPIQPSAVHDDAEIISVFVTSQVTRDIVEKMPKLKLITCRSAGFNNIDLSIANERNILVATAPSYGEHTVAEYTFSLLLSLTRKLPETIHAVKEHSSNNPIALRGTDIADKTLGVIGTGKIGKRVIEIAKGFSMHVIAYDPHQDNEAAITLGFQYASLDEVCKNADIITLHTPLTNDTEHLINSSMFEKMKDGVYIINTARGELIDAEALLIALNSNKVRGAALDVIEGEKLLRESPSTTDVAYTPTKVLQESFNITNLLSHQNVILTPHNAYNTDEAVLYSQRSS